MNRQDHLQWAKDRALEYVKANDNQQAFSSMMSDLNKHVDLQDSAKMCYQIGMLALQSESSHEMQKFIEGFN